MTIVVLLILVIFIYKLLFSNFGLTSDDEKRKQNDIANNFIKNVTNTANSNNDGKTKKKVVVLGNIEEFNKIYKNYLNRTNKQKKADGKVEFDESKFLKSAEKAIAMVMDAFSEKRLDVLEKMLTKDLFQIFKKRIENSEDLIYKAVVIAITDKTIESKIFNKRNKAITLKVTMDQINYVENTQGELISGSRDKTIRFTELWTFIQNQSKDLADDIWLLKSIDNA